MKLVATKTNVVLSLIQFITANLSFKNEVLLPFLIKLHSKFMLVICS